MHILGAFPIPVFLAFTLGIVGQLPQALRGMIEHFSFAESSLSTETVSLTLASRAKFHSNCHRLDLDSEPPSNITATM